ncbi:MAG: UvrB/UvrC motif-containing protein [Spirochaetota bacterium]
MLCDNCDNSEATLHLTEISNKIQSELHLCLKCAKNMQISPDNQGNSVSLHSMFSFIDNESVNEDVTGACPQCGLTAAQLCSDGQPGCPSCYNFFKNILGSSSTGREKKKYTGKKPIFFVEIYEDSKACSIGNNKQLKELETLGELEEELNGAVTEERYEYAAVLRDKIKEYKSAV